MTSKAAANVPADERARSGQREDPLFVQSVEKAFMVMTAFDAERPTMSLSQIADATGMEKSAAQRFSHTLCKLGYLHKDPKTKHFQLTPRALKPAYHYTQSNALVRLATPYLLDLRRDTGEAVTLSVLDGFDVVFVLRLLSPHSLATRVAVGAHMPAFCTASGRAILSRFPVEQAKAFLEQSDRRAYTENTITEIPALMESLRETAAHGYAICCSEYVINDITIAAPIVKADGSPIGAVHIGTTREKYTREEVESKYASAIINVALNLSTR